MENYSACIVAEEGVFFKITLKVSVTHDDRMVKTHTQHNKIKIKMLNLYCLSSSLIFYLASIAMFPFFPLK